MTEQELLEKAIKGLECCLPMTTRNGFADCGKCPYDRKITLEGGIAECCHELMLDAHALLKAQEPRVMTWHDVIGAAIECKPVYIEVKDSDDKEPGDDRWAMVTQYKDSITNGMIRAMSSYVTSEILFKDWYGKTWRCWTCRPDQATREAAKWE